jgi:hypothetical protein
VQYAEGFKWGTDFLERCGYNRLAVTGKTSNRKAADALLYTIQTLPRYNVFLWNYKFNES